MCPMCVTAAVLAAAKTTAAGGAAVTFVKKLVWPRREVKNAESLANMIHQQSNVAIRGGETQ